MRSKTPESLDWEKLSNAVEPSSTAITATVPGRTGLIGQMIQRIADDDSVGGGVPPEGCQSGHRHAVYLRGSARANHVEPNTAAPANIATA